MLGGNIIVFLRFWQYKNIENQRFIKNYYEIIFIEINKLFELKKLFCNNFSKIKKISKNILFITKKIYNFARLFFRNYV